MSGSLSRTSTAIFCARSNRVGAAGPFDASIERDVSITKNAAASLRTLCADLCTSVGCVAASPSRAAIESSEITAARRDSPCVSCKCEHRGDVPPAALRDDEGHERHDDSECHERTERRQKRH